MKRDKRGLGNAISMACARRKQGKKKAEQLTDSDDDIIDMVSSESEYEESEVDEAEQEEQRKQLMLEYAEYLGLNIYKHHSLIWIAAEALCCPLPDGWKEYVDGDENVVRAKRLPPCFRWTSLLTAVHSPVLFRERRRGYGRGGRAGRSQHFRSPDGGSVSRTDQEMHSRSRGRRQRRAGVP